MRKNITTKCNWEINLFLHLQYLFLRRLNYILPI